MMRARIRRTAPWLATMTSWLIYAPAVYACPVCFQIEDGPIAAGVRSAVMLLIGVTMSVLAVAGTFAVRFARRAARLSDEELR